MITAALRRLAREALHAQILRTSAAYDDWSSSAVVFAPHQDDETLGCGGTIAKKRALGTPVQVVFMTDGATSHASRIGRAELAHTRRAEALNACRVLGVADGSVTFLDFEDGALERRLDAATGSVRELLERHRPREVFVPHRMDAQADHLATRRSVLDALAMAGLSARVLEYPVWLWHHWPWVELPKRLTQNPAAVLTALRAEWALLRDSKWAARIDDVMAVKQRALRCHVSQMERPAHDASWPILADVSHGEWLACFFSGHELFAGSRGEP